MTCTDCRTRSQAISDAIGISYHTLCHTCREAAVRLYQGVRPSRSKSDTDYRQMQGR